MAYEDAGAQMRNLLAMSLCICFCTSLALSAEPVQDANAVFAAEPAARALYEGMVEAMRQAETLSYHCRYRWESNGRELSRSRYTVWLKKPNHFRVEMSRGEGEPSVILVGDGAFVWTFWTGDRPRFSIETNEDYEKTRRHVYLKAATPLGRHSIGHLVGVLPTGMIIDASTFHGYTDSLQPYLDGVKGMGTESVDGAECDVIEVSFMKHQRSWYIWLSRKDHLPRKVRQIVRVSHDIIMHEQWSDVVLNAALPDEKFVWAPPEGWREWIRPGPEHYLLKPGTEAPDFELAAVDGTKVKLSDHRDEIVWFYIWRAG